MLAELQKEIVEEFPSFRLVPKDESSFMCVLDALLRVITFGQMRSFMVTFTTTIGYTVYTPSVWPMKPQRSRAVILRHERVHMRQRRRLGLWYSVSYLLFPLPVVWAYCRMKYEMEAYEESLRALVHYFGVGVLDNANLRGSFISHFVGPEYFWTWPWRGRIERWYDDLVDQIREQ